LPLEYLRGIDYNYDTHQIFINVFIHFHYTHLSVSALAPKQLSDIAAQRRSSSSPKQFRAKDSRRQIAVAKTVAPKSTRFPKQGAQERVYATRVHHNHFFGSHGSFVYVVYVCLLVLLKSCLLKCQNGFFARPP